MNNSIKNYYTIWNRLIDIFSLNTDYKKNFFLKYKNVRPVVPKVCSADHWWSAKKAEVIRKSLF